MGKQIYKLGVIGMGLNNMGSTMALLKNAPDLRYEITGICSSNMVSAERCASVYGINFYTADYMELVSRNDVDVVCVFSPDHLHFEHCAGALGYGKHVVCTKPMVTDLEDAKTLVTLTREKRVKFLVGQTMRFDRQFLTAKKLFDDGDLGDLIALESFYNHDMRPVYELTPWRRTVPQDLMFGGCVHSIDVIRAFGGDVKSVHAVAIKGGLTDNYPICDNFFLNLTFTSGAIGRVSGLYGTVHLPGPMMMFGVYGTKGSVQTEFTDNEPGEFRVVYDKLYGHTPLVSRFGAETDGSVNGHGASVIRFMRHFQDCLDNGAEPSPNALDGAKSVAVGAAAWESVKTGKTVDVFNDFSNEG